MVVVQPVLTTNSDFGDVGSEDGDDVPHDAEYDDIPAEHQVNGGMREETATKDLPPTPGETQDEEDDSEEGEECVKPSSFATKLDSRSLQVPSGKHT